MRDGGVITHLDHGLAIDTFRGVGGGVVESHTAGGERPTGLEAPKAQRFGVTAPDTRPPSAGPKAGNRPEAGWYWL